MYFGPVYQSHHSPLPPPPDIVEFQFSVTTYTGYTYFYKIKHCVVQDIRGDSSIEPSCTGRCVSELIIELSKSRTTRINFSLINASLRCKFGQN